MTTTKTPAQMVDDLLAEVERGDWHPPIPRYNEPTFAPLSGYGDEYQRLMQHHQLETDTLMAVIREMRKRLKDTKMWGEFHAEHATSLDVQLARAERMARAWKRLAKLWWGQGP